MPRAPVAGRRGLRVGLTGGLGSGKSTVAMLLQEHGAHILQADEIARALMQPGEAVYQAIAEHFGPGVVAADGSLDRRELARLAFAEGRADELNRIVHPATIARQAQRMDSIFSREPDAVVVVESALLFETQHGPGWRDRFDRLVLVTAPEQVRIARFTARSGPAAGTPEQREAEARRRLALQMPDAAKIPCCDFVLQNDGTPEQLRDQVGRLWLALEASQP